MSQIRTWMLGVVALCGSSVTSPCDATAAALLSRQPGSAARVSLSVVDSTVGYALHEIARQANMRLWYDKTQTVLTQRVTVHVRDVTVGGAIAAIIKGTNLLAQIGPDGETILVRRDASNEHARTRQEGGTVAGRITDSTTGVGLKGVQLRVEGSPKLTTISSDSGTFTLKNVPSGDQVLEARLFGYRPVQRVVTVVDGERTTVRIVMVVVPTVLSGVVTTATGAQRKVEVGNDITSINVDSVMRVAPISSVTDLLETRVPGLTVLHSSGTPGDPSRIRLRGASSITNNNDPIIIVDGIRVYARQSDARNNNLAKSAYGINTGGSPSRAGAINESGGGYAAPSPLDQIDPNSIATIEVFKGPSASALYGSDAADGVIVITTKHGRAGPTQWSLNLGQGVNWLPGSWPANYYRFGYSDRNNGLLCAWNDLSCHVDSLIAFQALNDPRYTVFNHGSDQSASLTISGGVSTLTYSLTGSGASDIGNLKLPAIEQQRYEKFYGSIPGWMVRPDNYNTWGVNGSLTMQPAPAVRLVFQTSLFNSNQQRSSLEQAIVQLEGEYIDPTQLSSSPLLQNEMERATAASLGSTNALALEWQVRPWLPLNATGGLNTTDRTDQTLIPFGINSCSIGGSDPYNPTGIGFGCSSQGDTSGHFGLGRGTQQDKTLTVGTAIPMRWVTLAVGANLTDESTSDATAETNQLAPGVSVPASFPTGGSANSSFGYATASTSTYGWYVEPRLNVASRFFVSPGFRLDGGSGGSSSAGSVGGLSAFPKIDFSWIAVDRGNTRPLWGFLTQLRPRVAFGLAGTQPNPEDRLRLFTPGVQQLNDSSTVPVVGLATLGNTQLRPERTRELEGGIDASLWNGWLEFTYSRYDKTRTDAIIAIPIPPSIGGNVSGGGVVNLAQVLKNIGVVRNTGSELQVTAHVLRGRTLDWNVGTTISNDNNLVVSLNPGQGPIAIPIFESAFQSRVTPGYPLFSQWARPILTVVDVNHDGIIEPGEFTLGDSLVYVGQQEPKYTANLTTDLLFFNGRLGIHAGFQYQNGLTQVNQGALNSNTFSLLPNTPNTPLVLQAQTVAANCVAPSGPAPLCAERVESVVGVIQTVNTFRFNDLSINYEVPTRISSTFHVPRMSVALQGTNLGLHTNYRGADPNVNAFSTAISAAQGGDITLDNGQVPQARTWWLKMTLGN